MVLHFIPTLQHPFPRLLVVLVVEEPGPFLQQKVETSTGLRRGI